MALSARRIAQDEVHITCNRCAYFVAAALTIDGKYSGKYTVVKSGTCRQHNLQSALNNKPPDSDGKIPA